MLLYECLFLPGASLWKEQAIEQSLCGRLAEPTSVMRAIAVRMKRRRVGSPYIDETALSHGSKLIDAFAPGDRKRHGIDEFFDQEIGRQRLFVVQRAIQGGNHRLLDLRTAESLWSALWR